jgi:hypothetical protein
VSEIGLNLRHIHHIILLLENVMGMVKRVNVELDACLLDEAKRLDINIEQATLKHFENVKHSFS